MYRCEKAGSIAFAILMAVVSCPAFAASHEGMTMGSSPEFDRQTALDISRAAIGRPLSDAQLQRSDGSYVHLADYRGKPLVLSFIYTSCYHICPTTTKHLDRAVRKARNVLGADSFYVASIGFDTVRDTPPMMNEFAAKQQVHDDRWQFLSADQPTVDTLTRQAGFIFYPTGNGFDHLVQTTILDADGRVFRQIYGMDFELPLLIEPLKRLVFATSEDNTLLQSVGKQVRLFCTVYDPASGSYRFDYSVFVGTFIGILCVGWVGFHLVKEWRYTLKHQSRSQ